MLIPSLPLSSATSFWLLGAGPAGTYPVINLVELELLEPADLLSRQSLVVDPARNRVFRYTEVVRDGLDGDPRFVRHSILFSTSAAGPEQRSVGR